MFAVGKNLRLVGEIGAAGIDEIDAGQPVFARDFLRAQMLLHRDRIVRAALDRGVVADDHAFAALDASDAGDDSGGMDVAVVHAEGGERRNSRNGEPGSTSRSTRSRGRNLPRVRMALARAFVAAQRSELPFAI